jgi:hypothetical protein
LHLIGQPEGRGAALLNDLTANDTDDPEDRRDILTMMALDRLSPQAVRQAIADARIPDLPDLIEQFQRSKAFIEEHLAMPPKVSQLRDITPKRDGPGSRGMKL